MSSQICYQVSKPGMEFHMIYNVRGIAHERTNRKDDIFMQRRLGQILDVYWSGGKGLVKNQNRPRPELTQT